MAEPFTGSTAQTVASLSLSVKSSVRTGESSRKKHISCSLIEPRMTPTADPLPVVPWSRLTLTIFGKSTTLRLHQLHHSCSISCRQQHLHASTAHSSIPIPWDSEALLGIFFSSWLGSLNVSEQLQCTHSYEHLFLSFIPLLWAWEN